MLPFIGIDETAMAPLRPFGICVAVAFFVWDFVLMKLAVRRGFERSDVRVMTIWLGVFGWLFAWGVDAIFYHPEGALAPGVGIQRLSSTGAIFGATVGTILWSRIHVRKEAGGLRASWRKEPIALLSISEVILATYPAAFAIGRLGCALIHDHVGKAVAKGTIGSLFAVGFPRTADDGSHFAFGPIHVVIGASDVRYDLGLLEVLVLTPLAIGFALTWKRSLKPGTYTTLALLTYGPLRFVLDFLRADDGPTADARHGGLTFAQFWALAVIATGIALLVYRRRSLRFATSVTPIGQPAD